MMRRKVRSRVPRIAAFAVMMILGALAPLLGALGGGAGENVPCRATAAHAPLRSMFRSQSLRFAR
jgi:hypothetical protein